MIAVHSGACQSVIPPKNSNISKQVLEFSMFTSEIKIQMLSIQCRKRKEIEVLLLLKCSSNQPSRSPSGSNPRQHVSHGITNNARASTVNQRHCRTDLRSSTSSENEGTRHALCKTTSHASVFALGASGCGVEVSKLGVKRLSSLSI